MTTALPGPMPSTYLIDEAETEMQPRRSKISRKKGTL
eukprot:CAMPEP_0205932570 /NCGR_PEP_ID=MMETSP1325-20131115/30249_1 /ASSEMBLY_ACC=CAM_ASM_000708 /TAXON_ID=236786 /ORGANISM="Florenciella sp., Strain RCC1007" /LENGTH=36 /DNA_ID= /DNA_START= /DNA_END= /DNA_ORIENTATION=